MTTLRDVARAAGVSVASASRAMNGHAHVAPDLRARVVAAARRLDYVPHSGARSLTMRHTGTIGVVLPDLFGEFFSEIIRGVDRAAHQRGLHLLLTNMHGDADETASALRTMRGRVDGLLIMSPHVDADFLSRNLPRGMPVIVMNGSLGGAGHGSISIDSEGGARMMVAHLVDQGYRRIAHICGPRDNSDAQARLAGFRAAMADLVGDDDPPVFDGDFTEDGGERAGRLLVARADTIDAVFAGNDVMALGCMAALKEAGIAVPGDIAVAGFDDIPIARYVAPGLSTIRVGIAEMGGAALEDLLDAIARPDDPHLPARILTPHLVVRQSTARAAGNGPEG